MLKLCPFSSIVRNLIYDFLSDISGLAFFQIYVLGNRCCNTFCIQISRGLILLLTIIDRNYECVGGRGLAWDGPFSTVIFIGVLQPSCSDLDCHDRSILCWALNASMKHAQEMKHALKAFKAWWSMLQMHHWSMLLIDLRNASGKCKAGNLNWSFNHNRPVAPINLWAGQVSRPSYSSTVLPNSVHIINNFIWNKVAVIGEIFSEHFIFTLFLTTSKVHLRPLKIG